MGGTQEWWEFLMSFLLYAFQRQLGIYCICYSDLLNRKWRVASQTCDIDFLRGVRSSLPDWGLGAVLSWDHRFWSLINQQVDVNIKGNLFSHRILLENFDVWQNFKLKYVWTRFLSQKYSSWADCDSYTWTPASLCASLQIVWLAKSALVVILANCRASLLRSHSFQRYSPPGPPRLALSGCTTVWTYNFIFFTSLIACLWWQRHFSKSAQFTSNVLKVKIKANNLTVL